MAYNLLRLPVLLKRRKRSRSAHYLDIQKGVYPKPIKIGERAVAWLQEEDDEITAARIAGWSDDEIRALVVKLVAARKSAI